MAEEILEDMDAPIEDVYTDESSYYLEQEKSDLPLPDRTTFIEKIIEQLNDEVEDENTLIFWFETAWSPPENVFHELISQGYEVKLAYYETGMDYCGVLTNENHEYTEDVLSHTRNKTLPKWATDEFDVEEIYGEEMLSEVS